jgi:glycosyltransferase involved in cell wall biosynthesis
MKLSVIIPTRNRAALAARAVASVCMQRDADFEVIVLDDGSNPEQREALVTALAAFDPVLLIHVAPPDSPGSGPSAVRNAGIEAASGALLAFCDDDDEWVDPGHLACVIEAFAANPELDLYVGNQEGWYAGVLERATWLPGLPALGQQSTPPLVMTSAQWIKAGGFPHLNTIVTRRERVREIGGFWPLIRYEEDRDFFWRLLDRCRQSAYCPAIMARHHIPDRALKVNASTRWSALDKRLMSAQVSRHVALSVTTPEIQKLATDAEAFDTQHLVHELLQRGERRQAARLAWVALGLRFSWRWLARTLLLQMKAILPGEAR